MISNSEISTKYYSMLMQDADIRQKVDEATEALYLLVTNDNILEIHLRYDIDTAKKIAFCLRILGYCVEEYRHGKLQVKVM